MRRKVINESFVKQTDSRYVSALSDLSGSQNVTVHGSQNRSPIRYLLWSISCKGMRLVIEDVNFTLDIYLIGRARLCSEYNPIAVAQRYMQSCKAYNSNAFPGLILTRDPMLHPAMQYSMKPSALMCLSPPGA